MSARILLLFITVFTLSSCHVLPRKGIHEIRILTDSLNANTERLVESYGNKFEAKKVIADSLQIRLVKLDTLISNINNKKSIRVFENYLQSCQSLFLLSKNENQNLVAFAEVLAQFNRYRAEVKSIIKIRKRIKERKRLW